MIDDDRQCQWRVMNLLGFFCECHHQESAKSIVAAHNRTTTLSRTTRTCQHVNTSTRTHPRTNGNPQHGQTDPGNTDNCKQPDPPTTPNNTDNTDKIQQPESLGELKWRSEGPWFDPGRLHSHLWDRGLVAWFSLWVREVRVQFPSGPIFLDFGL